MKKFLRFSLMMFFAMIGTSAFAEDIIWQEDFSSYAKDDVPSGGTYSYVCTDGASATKIYEEALAGGAAPELLVSKKSNDVAGGTFTATVSLGGRTGDFYLAFKCNKNISVSVSGGTLGEVTKTGNDYVYPITGASGTLTVKFENTLTTNARLDNIKLYQGQGLLPAGLSWGTSARTVTIGADDNVFPELQNDNNLPITYSSSETSVATINSSGSITLIAAGQTVITASFAGDSQYEAAEVSYTLTVKEAAGPVTVTEVDVAGAMSVINGLEDNQTTTDEYKVTGFIVTDPDFQTKPDGSYYGNCNFEIADAANGTTTLTVFRTKSFDNQNFTEEQINAGILKKGDKVVIQGKLQKYIKDGAVVPELKNCYLISVNGSSNINSLVIDNDVNAPMYNLKGQRVDANYRGVVIQNGQKRIQK
jgi:hypothetical protein